MRPARVAAWFAILETLAHARYLNGSIESATVLRRPIQPTYNPYASEPVAALSTSSTISARTAAPTSSTTNIPLIIPYVPLGSSLVLISTATDISAITTTATNPDLNTPNALSVLLSALRTSNPTIAPSVDAQTAISSAETLLSAATVASSTLFLSQALVPTTASVPLVVIPTTTASGTPNALSVLIPALSTYTGSYQTYFTSLPSPSSSASESVGTMSTSSRRASTGASTIASSTFSTEIASASSSTSTESTRAMSTSTFLNISTTTQSSTRHTSTAESSTASSTATTVPAAPPAGAAAHSHGLLPRLLGMLCVSWSLFQVL